MRTAMRLPSLGGHVGTSGWLIGSSAHGPRNWACRSEYLSLLGSLWWVCADGLVPSLYILRALCLSLLVARQSSTCELVSKTARDVIGCRDKSLSLYNWLWTIACLCLLGTHEPFSEWLTPRGNSPNPGLVTEGQLNPVLHYLTPVFAMNTRVKTQHQTQVQNVNNECTLLHSAKDNQIQNITVMYKMITVVIDW